MTMKQRKKIEDAIVEQLAQYIVAEFMSKPEQKKLIDALAKF